MLSNKNRDLFQQFSRTRGWLGQIYNARFAPYIDFPRFSSSIYRTIARHARFFQRFASSAVFFKFQVQGSEATYFVWSNMVYVIHLHSCTKIGYESHPGPSKMFSFLSFIATTYRYYWGSIFYYVFVVLCGIDGRKWHLHLSLPAKSWCNNFSHKCLLFACYSNFWRSCALSTAIN